MSLRLQTTDEHQLALEIARNDLGMQRSIPELIAYLHIDKDVLLALLKNPQFKSMVRAYRAELEKDHEGVRLKSAIALEDSIPLLHRIIHHPDTPPNVVVQGCKQLADMAGLNKTQQAEAQGAGFVVNIDLSGLKGIDTKSFQGKPIDVTAEKADPNKIYIDESGD